VKSTLEMKYVLQDLQRDGLKFPVICGGAAVSERSFSAEAVAGRLRVRR